MSDEYWRLTSPEVPEIDPRVREIADEMLADIPPRVVIVRAVQTCHACPSQWNAWDSEGNYWYLRYRWGVGTAERQRRPDDEEWAAKTFEHGDALDGFITLEEFCQLAGLELALGEQP